MQPSRKLSEAEKNYIDKWQREAKKWREFGLFDRAASLLKSKEDGIHVDLGSGNGAMLVTLKSRYPDITLIGAERYRVLLTLANVSLQAAKIPSQVLNGAENISGHDHPGLRSDPVSSSSVTLVRDDIKSLPILRKLLGENGIDSASFMFPGISKISVLQPSKDVQEQELLTLMDNVRKAVCRQLSELVRFGGRLVLAEKSSSESVSDGITQIIKRMLGGYDQYWDPDDGDILTGVGDDISGIEWIDTVTGKIPKRDDGLVFIVQSFVRNHFEFEGKNAAVTVSDRKKRKSDELKKFIAKVMSRKVQEE